MTNKKPFKAGMHVFCKNHGLGFVTDVSEIDIMDQVIRCFDIFFERDNLKISVPEEKMHSIGIRRLADKSVANDVMKIFRSESKGMRVIWSKRSKEYEQKLYSGDIFVTSEVVRDLYKNSLNPSRSYSERVIFEKALERVCSELAAIQDKSLEDVFNEVCKTLSVFQETFDSPEELDDSIDASSDVDSKLDMVG
jgi:CarD family transcriptional regulator